MVVPMFVLEELGVPLPLVLSGIFTSIGYALATGNMNVLLFIPANLVGTLIGATGLYWAGRRGVSLPFWRKVAGARLAFLATAKFTPDRGMGLLTVIAARMTPLPMSLVSMAFGAVRLPYWMYALGTIIATLVWNAIFIAGGIAAGLLSTHFMEGVPVYLRYTPVLGVWIGLAVALALWRRRRARGRAVSPEALVQ